MRSGGASVAAHQGDSEQPGGGPIRATLLYWTGNRPAPASQAPNKAGEAAGRPVRQIP